jgi:metal-sulfur cluster biosynthetic enzyme/drug/metabolite transporter (DMT)-like permease
LARFRATLAAASLLRPVDERALRNVRRGGPRPVLALLLVTVIWGWTFVWMKRGVIASERVLGADGVAAGVALFMSLRFALAAGVLAFWPSARRGLRAAWRGGLVLGGLLFAGFVLQMLGLGGVSPPVSAFLTSLYVVFTALLTALAGGARPGPLLALGVVLATLGAGFIGGPPHLTFGWAEWLTVGCAIVFALHILATDVVTRSAAAMPVTLSSFCWVAGFSGMLLAATSLSGGHAPGELARLALVPDFAWPMLASSILATVLALSLMNLYQRELDPVRAAILYAVEPVWASVISIASGLSRPDLWLFAGGGALLAGNVLAELGPLLASRRRQRSALPPAGGSLAGAAEGGDALEAAAGWARLVDPPRAPAGAGRRSMEPTTSQLDQLYAELRQVYDPEIPVNIVDLGLIYDVQVEGSTCNVTMTLTSQACPEARTIPDVVRRRCNSVPGIETTDVKIVWEPAWTPQRISEEGRKTLGIGEEYED